MDYFVAAFAVLLGDGGANLDPHPQRTLFRGVLVRTLDDGPLRLSLGLSRERSENLVRFLQETDRRQAEFFAKTESNAGERAAQLQRGASARAAKNVEELRRALGDEALRTLAGAALRHWGAPAAFATGVASELEVSGEQRRRAEKSIDEALRRREAALADPTKTPNPSELAALANSARKSLDAILTENQRSKRDRLQESSANRTLQLYVETEANREDRESRPPVLAIHRPKHRILRLLEIDEVLDLLGMRGDRRAAVVTFRKKAAKLEADLATLRRNDADSQRERAEKLQEFDAGVERESADLLGEESYRRLREIRWQLAGVGAAFGDEGRALLDVTPEQAQAAVSKLQEIADRSAESLQGADPGKFTRLARKQQQDMTDAMLSVLSSKQREAWRKLQGEPVRAETLARIAKRL